jgi:hypothetical protein
MLAAFSGTVALYNKHPTQGGSHEKTGSIHNCYHLCSHIPARSRYGNYFFCRAGSGLLHLPDA